MFERDPLFDLGGRVIVITGGAGLLGREYAAALSARGAHVVVADRAGEAAAEVVASLPGAPGLALQVDIARREDVDALVARVAAAWGRVDGLVNNAALDPKFDPEHQGEHGAGFEGLSLDVWERALDVNLTGMFLCTQAVGRFMKEATPGRGAIVNVSSIYGMVGPDQRIYERPGQPPAFKPITYTVTKSAVFGFTRYLATYWGSRGPRVNTLTLGGVYNQHDDEFVARYAARVPLGRMARRDEYCGALIYLLSDASSYMTGGNLVVDGGWTAW